MSTKKRRTAEHRRVWRENHGPIPRGYHIHHIDGNHFNNDISNLQCVTAQEHYDIHFSQGDYFACFKLYSQHIDCDKEKLSQLLRNAQLQRVKEGTHPFLTIHHNRDYLGENNPNYGNKWSEEKKKALSDLRRANGKSAGENNSMYGIKRTDLTERNKAARGKHWYTNGITSKQYFPHDVPIGWKKGRI